MIAPPNPATASKPKKPAVKHAISTTRLFIWGGVVAAFAIIAFFAAKHLSSSAPPPNAPGVRVLPVSPVSTVTSTPKPQVAKPAKTENNPKALEKKTVRPAMSREEREKAAYKKLVETPIDLVPKTNRIFRTGIEASMARIFMTKLGDPPPPPFTTALTIRDEAHLAEILIAANPVRETDTQAQADSKEMVELAKKEMMEYIKKGGDPEEFLVYYRGKLQEAFDTRRESMVSLMKIAREEPELAAEYLARINANLAEKGIRTIELTDKQKERMGLKQP